MKAKKIELDVDSIGEQRGLTQAEEKALTDFFKKRKSASNSSKIKQRLSAKKHDKAFA